MVSITSADGRVQESRAVQLATCMTNCKNDGLHTGQRCCLKPVSTLLSSAMKLWRLCFYMCLSVILFTGGCLGPHLVGKLRGLAGEGVSRPTPRGLSWGVWLGGGGGGVCPGGMSAQDGGVCPGGVCPPPTDSYCCGWYAFYWNAFLCYRMHWLQTRMHSNRIRTDNQLTISQCIGGGEETLLLQWGGPTCL